MTENSLVSCNKTGTFSAATRQDLPKGSPRSLAWTQPANHELSRAIAGGGSLGGLELEVTAPGCGEVDGSWGGTKRKSLAKQQEQHINSL